MKLETKGFHNIVNKQPKLNESAEFCKNFHRNKRTVAEERGSLVSEFERIRMSAKFIILTFAFWISVAIANPAKSKSNYIEQENSCRQVCGLCDCDGFYCEDECICECNLGKSESKEFNLYVCW